MRDLGPSMQFWVQKNSDATVSVVRISRHNDPPACCRPRSVRASKTPVSFLQDNNVSGVLVNKPFQNGVIELRGDPAQVVCEHAESSLLRGVHGRRTGPRSPLWWIIPCYLCDSHGLGTAPSPFVPDAAVFGGLILRPFVGPFL